MFASAERNGGHHHVLLDGGLGSFAFSETTERLWRDPRAAAWAWSSGVPHHVTVTEKEVAVVRWDRPGAEEFSRHSVESGLESFYSYLIADRVQSTRRVVEHLIDVFRRTRSLIHGGSGDEAAVRAYLGILATAINRTRAAPPIAVPDQELLASLPGASVDVLVSQAIDATGLPVGRPDVGMLPELAIRHAGSEIFQEAHFALESAGDRDLFDWVTPATSVRKTRGTSHFTPPALARSLVEQTFAELGDIRALASLTILDPASGSGSFLYEAIRTARRAGFNGQLRLVGRDISRAAVDMARFLLTFAAGDWSPAGGIQIDLEVADALNVGLPPADIVLMNPPFMAWTVMSGALRDRMKLILGDVAKGRVDLSMAFISRALDVLRPGGAIGTIMPASVLASGAAEGWRSSIRERADLRLIASLGEYGLFAHAAINVAAFVAKRKGEGEPDRRDVVAVIGGQSPESTGDALRALRGAAEMTPSSSSRDRWQVFALPQVALDQAPNWRPVDPAVRDALVRIETLGLTRPLGEIFEVLQGARTGWVKGFVLDATQLATLDHRERRFFKPAAMGDNIVNGRLVKESFVFFPYDENGPPILSEDDLRKKLPVYYERFLKPNREMLMRRVTHSGRDDWWTLARPRGWNLSSQPRIVSKYFGGVGGFALDPDGTYVVVQGFGWFLRGDGSLLPEEPGPDLLDDDAEQADIMTAEDVNDAAAISKEDLLAAHVAFLNSTTFEKLLATFSSHVAGGQYDLSWRFVRSIPIPDFAAMWGRESRAAEIAHLVDLGRAPNPDDRDWSRHVNRALHGFYGSELLELL